MLSLWQARLTRLLAVQVLADMENLRKRTQQQVAQAHQYALQDFCKDILEVTDNLDRALDSVPANVLEASERGESALAHGPGAEGQVTCNHVAKSLLSLHNGVAMSNKVSAASCKRLMLHEQSFMFACGLASLPDPLLCKTALTHRGKRDQCPVNPLISALPCDAPSQTRCSVPYFEASLECTSSVVVGMHPWHDHD
jgi:hypothetical protein